MINYNAFKKLQDIFNVLSKQKIIDLFGLDNNRGNNFSLQLDDLYLDFSKNLINKDAINSFVDLANQMDMSAKIKAMFEGKKINFTENRAVLHSALRNSKLKELNVDGHNVLDDIKQEKNKLLDFVSQFSQGNIRGINGDKIIDIVNIGIGGSYLGTQMVYNALKSQAVNNINIHFVSNVDASNLADILEKINPLSTLFVVASKTFTTAETMENAKTIKQWFLNKLNDDNLASKAISKHFIALSTNLDAVGKFGIDVARTFGFWDFVGGRYSLWSSIGLPIAIMLGVEKLEELLAGAFIVDEHLQNSKLEENIPFMLAIIGIWYNNFFNYNSYAILPYDYRLRDFTRYVQQLEMESNGKSVNNNGEFIAYNTSPVVFGEPGSDAQHSFFQLLHQGTNIIPCDFIGFIKPNHSFNHHQDILISNLFAQSEALLQGKNEEVVRKELLEQGLNSKDIDGLTPHKVFLGNRPSNTLLFKELSPKTLGMLCAIYEHKIFIQGLFWEINSFDQWGVELGKKLANNILKSIKEGDSFSNLTSSSVALINRYKHS